MKKCYVHKKFTEASKALIAQANSIVEEYAAQGFDLTLRQLYYQLVARGIIANQQKEYNRLGGLIGDARLAGLVRWDRIVDRTRNVQSVSHWSSPSDIINACASSYRIDKWAGQKYRPAVWIEKEALVGVIEPTCRANDVEWFACRGYVSLSELWSNAQKMLGRLNNGQKPVIIHLGDHDPSGIDMTRDIGDRLYTFGVHGLKVKRIALNMDQVEEQQPPPNPAKSTDSRFQGYLDEYGDESWELDALSPTYIAEIIEEAIAEFRDEDAYLEQETVEAEARRFLRLARDNWAGVTEYLGNLNGADPDEDEEE